MPSPTTRTSRITRPAENRRRNPYPVDRTRRQQLDEVISFSRDMPEAAKQQQWDRVAELEASRRQLLMTCLGESMPQQAAASTREAIEEVLDLDRQLAGLAEQCQAELGGEIQTRNRGQAATSAYLSHTG